LKNVLIIANPKAGKASAKKFLPKIEQFLKSNQFSFTTYFTKNTTDYEGISSAIKSVEELFALLIVDENGTLNDVVNSIPENFKPLILILPCGSGNDFAKFIHGNKRLEEILNCLNNISSKATDCGICNNKRFINGLGIGFDGWVAGKANEGAAWLPAQLKYHFTILRGLFKFKFFESNLGKSLIIAVANGPPMAAGSKSLQTPILSMEN
jgi:diacylglycerol kinase (ATP)